jgi:CxxC-x17-CxxC domain-containing protein
MGFNPAFLQCTECSNTFISPANEQEHFLSKGYYYEPKRCPSCRQSKRAQRTIGIGDNRRMYPVVCNKCEIDTEVPFEPREGIPVYCSDCYGWFAQSRY